MGDADETARLVREHGEGCECVAIQGDITEPDCAPRAVAEFLERARAPRLDVLVNNAAA